ncbi:MAG: BON domain-containing protein [Candidatus Acidiferrum sp.]
MRSSLLPGALLTLLVFLPIAGCSHTREESPDVTHQIRSSLDQAGLKDVSVSQDRAKGVVTLTGTAQSEDQRGQAESIAKSIATNQVVANEVSVEPKNDESAAKTENSDIDKGIEKNFDAVLVKHHLNRDVKYDVKNGVVTLTGDVHSQAQRKDAEKLAHQVPNVRQVVNELEVKGQKATTS